MAGFTGNWDAGQDMNALAGSIEGGSINTPYNIPVFDLTAGLAPPLPSLKTTAAGPWSPPLVAAGIGLALAVVYLGAKYAKKK